MNYLAHLLLAQPTADSCFGNLLGDFQKGIRLHNFSDDVISGVHTHVMVDKFTDQHPIVLNARQAFSRKRRRFAGIALDIFFDHLLIQRWDHFTHIRFEIFCEQRYSLLASRISNMPMPMQSVVASMIKNRWLSNYESLEGVSYAMDRTAKRIRFKNNFYNAIEEILPMYDTLAAEFMVFFPELQRHVRLHSPEHS